MRFYRIKIVSLFAVSIVAILIGMKLEAILTLVIAILNIYSYHNFSRVSEIKEVIGIKRKVLSFLFTSFSISLLVAVLFFIIKVSYFGVPYIRHYLTQSIIIFIILTSSIFVFPSNYNNEIDLPNVNDHFEKEITKILKYNLSFYLTITFSILITAFMKLPFFSAFHLLLIKIISDIIFIISNTFNSKTNTSFLIRTPNEESPKMKSTIDILDPILISIVGLLLLLSAYTLGLQRGGVTTAIAMAFFSFLFMRFMICIDISNKQIDWSWIAIPFLFLIAVFVIYSLNFSRMFFIAELSMYNWHIVFLLCFVMLAYVYASGALKGLYISIAANKDS